MEKSSIFLSHPTANLFSRKLAYSLLEEDLLDKFVTSIAQRKNKGPRFLEPSLYHKTTTHSWREWGRLLSNRLPFFSSFKNEAYPFSTTAVYQSLDRFASRLILSNNDTPEVVYAYEDGALETFRAGKSIGARCVYDLPIAYWGMRKEIYKDTLQIYPEWENTVNGWNDSEAKLQRKDKELERADFIVVPSEFVRSTLPDEIIFSKKVVIAPFGTSYLSEKNTPSTLSSGKLKVLFAGTLTQRKGLADLCHAINQIKSNHIELIVAGSLVEDLSFYKNQCSSLEYVGKLSHSELLALMEQCDLFCLPSIAEGRALVIQEAMGAGLPTIITSNTGCEDLIEEEKNGFVVPIHSPESIAEKLLWCLENRKHLQEMRSFAKASAQRFTWESYTAQIIQALKDG